MRSLKDSPIFSSFPPSSATPRTNVTQMTVPCSLFPVPYFLFPSPCSLHLHFVEVLEAAGADEHEEKKDEVVGGVDEGAGGEGAGGEAGEAEYEADAVEEKERAERVCNLVGVHGGEGKACEQGADD